MGIFYGKKCNGVSLGVISGKKIYWCIVGGYFWWKKCNGVTLLTKKWQGKYCFVIVVLLTTHITILWLGLSYNIKFPLWLSWYSKLFLLHSFFYKNKVYKNAEPQIWWNLKNILDAQFDKVFSIVLILRYWGSNSPFQQKVQFFCDFTCIFFTWNVKIHGNFD